jgi:hypothetical protein
VLVVEACLDTATDYIVQQGVELNSWIALAFTELQSVMKDFTPQQKIDYILAQFRYARFRTTWNKQRIIAEFGLAPTCSALTETILKAIIQLMVDFEEGVRKHGIAPKTQQELRVEKVLRDLGVWK